MSPEAQPSKAVLMSIKTRFVRSILNGSKTHELRRKVPRDAAGMRVFIYSSGVDRAITVHAEVSEVAAGTPEYIWRKYADVLGVTKEEFHEYFDGTDVAYAIRLDKVTPSQKPVSLEQMRNEHQLEPPQSWRYIPAESYARLAKSSRLSLDA
jgi:predicted transcriptional regulator